MIINKNVMDIIKNAEKKLEKQFEYVEEVATYNQAKVLDAFRENNIGLRHYASTNGYGYDDIGRDTLCKLFAQVFGGESAIVSPLIVSGTHALSLTLQGILRPNDKMLCISGAPYDTLQEVIGGNNIGSLKDYGISCSQINLIDGDFDYEAIKIALSQPIKLIFIGRSRGYEWRDALSIDQIEKVVKFIRQIDKNVVIMCDNCYGEFIDKKEPVEVGVDIMAGSLIKNPGGGIAPTGGYVCGREDLVQQVGFRLTAPSIGMEVGSYAYGYKDFYQGFFMAPSVVSNAIKASMIFGQVFEDFGYETMPKPTSICNDIIRSIKFDTQDQLISFCRSIQKASPIDSNAVPYPWDMPGYENQVIMAAGTFVAGASIELSADSPIKEPYIAYMQGSLTYEHAKIALMLCLQDMKLV